VLSVSASPAPRALTAAQAQQAQAVQALLQRGRAAEALPLAQRLVAEADEAPDAHMLLALCQAEAGATAAAEQAFQRALALAPGQPLILTNLATLLRRLQRPTEAVALLHQAVQAAPALMPAWRQLGLTALDAGDAALARQALRRVVQGAGADAAVWHTLGMAERALGDFEAAEAALRQTLALQPGHARAWVNLGGVLRLLGRVDESASALEQARQAGFEGPELDHALAGVELDRGRPDAAFVCARRLVEQHPAYAEGHATLAHLRWEYGETIGETISETASELRPERDRDTPAGRDDPLQAFRDAAHRQPDNAPLQNAWLRMLLEARLHEEALFVAQALRARADTPLLAMMEAGAYEGLGRSAEAGAVYEKLIAQIGERSWPALLNASTRHLLKRGAWDAAARRAEVATQIDPLNQEAWAYLGTAWRLLDDPRERVLCDCDRLVGVVDVEAPAGFGDSPAFLQALQAALEPLHQARREPVQQSLRGGSQTPGRLFGRPDPVIAATATALQHAVETWLAGLPAAATRSNAIGQGGQHPFLARNTGRIRYSGSWSVKLRSSGRHVNHIHSEGWISSAFYVALPPSVARQDGATPEAGCIQFGQPPDELGLGLPPRRIVRPRPGQLALFPSYLWHGTVPFEDTEPRLTVAFDMLPRG
jgi:Flp pilus assembly protein TadD